MAHVRKESRSSGMVIIDTEECKGCGLCVEVCPPNVLQISEVLNRMGYHPAKYKGIECTGCGVCFYVCPEPGAITVYKKREAYEQHHMQESTDDAARACRSSSTNSFV